MNERIKQFAQEAGFKVDWQHKDVQAIKMERFEKFAALIVKECALLCISRPSPGDDVRSREHCREQILEHFGIEE